MAANFGSHPFLGSGTTCLACDEMSVPSFGIEAHPFVYRVAQAKLSYATDPERLISKAEKAFRFARKATAQTTHYPEIIGKCYGLEALDYLDRFRQAVEVEQDGSPEAGLLWMALVSSLRAVSEAGTAPWQYVLPGRRKTVPPLPEVTLHKAVQMIVADIRFMARRAKPLAKLRVDDAPQVCNRAGRLGHTGHHVAALRKQLRLRRRHAIGNGVHGRDSRLG